MPFKLLVNDIAAEVKLAFLSMDLPVKLACSTAVFVAGENTKTKGRADLRSHLGAKLAGAWSVRYYPGGGRSKPPPSIDAAAFVYHKLPFVSIFEDGGTIHGNPLLWLPLSTTPKKGPGWKGNITPKKLEAKGVKLVTLKNARTPLLAARLPAFDPLARRKQRLTVSRVRKSLKANPHGKALQTIPLFFGIRSVTIRKRLQLRAIATEQLNSLGQYYVVNLTV